MYGTRQNNFFSYRLFSAWIFNFSSTTESQCHPCCNSKFRIISYIGLDIPLWKLNSSAGATQNRLLFLKVFEGSHQSPLNLPFSGINRIYFHFSSTVWISNLYFCYAPLDMFIDMNKR